MKQIETIVTQVVRRLFLQDLVTRLPYYLFGCLVVAAVAVAGPKIFYWEPWSEAAGADEWLPAWGIGSVFVAVGLCLISCWRTKSSRLHAAEVLDERFELQQRVSATLASSAESADPIFYQALLNDTQEKIQHLQVRERFPIQSRWPLALPLVPILGLVGMTFVPNFVPESAAETTELTATAREELQQLIKTANVKKEESKLEAEEELEGAEMVKQALADVEKVLAKKESTKREVLVALNDVKKAIEDQQSRLGKTDALKERLKQMKEQTKGPAEKFNNALQDGNVKEAQDQLSQLAEKIAKGEMGAEDMKKLGEQMENLKQQLDEMKAAVENEKRDLERQIEKAIAEGNLDQAAELEKKKAGLEQQQRQMGQLDKLAKQAEQIAELMKQMENGEMGEGQKQALKEALEDMKQQLQEMDLDEQQMKELQDKMNQMEEMKQKMRGEGDCEGGECEGEGEGENEGEGQGKGKGEKQGNGMGDGQGMGLRPEAKEDTKFYDTQTKPNVKPGEVAKIGSLGGPNRKGVTQVEIQNAIQEAAESKELTPNDLQDIPVNQREHVRQYFQKLRQK
ncbi:MAG: hypothetical protein JNL67_14850 [Planctomycetaceae bacterium]|nr:hypothetical protein [Planctomycetaceae bacterium]